jgi:hypothetical protein
MRCAEFYEKWVKVPNFCEVADRTAERIEEYLQIVAELEKEGISRVSTIGGFSEGASRPLHGLVDPIRGRVLKLIAGAIKRDQAVSAADIRVWIGMAEGKEPAAKDPRAGEGAAPAAPAAPLTCTQGLPGTPGAQVITVSQESQPAPPLKEGTVAGAAEVLRVRSVNVQVTAEDAVVLAWLVKTGRARDSLAAAQQAFDTGIDRLQDFMEEKENLEGET